MVLSKFTVALTIAGLVAVAAPASARDLSMGKHSADELKATCARIGGSFSQGKERYGCGTDCHGAPGTDCIVSCGADGKCTAQLMGGRRAHTLESALKR
ncbi:hypothetical protein [Pseudolabrys sp. Root1462]|uniref:hypothetical protein n=1 Tax=Pseudolabrys sp. Root1462 TaxID=1736466 RepID=UPI0012E3A640|nr:hypothetical protein [Pseudolabrys sp. Root1462]